MRAAQSPSPVGGPEAVEFQELGKLCLQEGGDRYTMDNRTSVAFVEGSGTSWPQGHPHLYHTILYCRLSHLPTQVAPLRGMQLGFSMELVVPSPLGWAVVWAHITLVDIQGLTHHRSFQITS